MNGPRRTAPLQRDTLALCGVLIQELDKGRSHPVLRDRLGRGCLRLLDSVSLALGDFDRAGRLLDADAELRSLRTQILLAYELGMVEEDLFLALAEQCDRIGRQIGGWRRSLGALR